MPQPPLQPDPAARPAGPGKAAEWWLWLGLALAALVVAVGDRALSERLIAPRHGFVDQISRILSYFGYSWVLFWLALLPAALFDRPALALRSAAGLIVLLIVVHALKHGVGRVRPIPTGAESFPSGHAATAFFLASLWARIGSPRARWLYAAAAPCALARVTMGRHFPSDIIAGALIGLIVARALARAPLRLEPERLRWLPGPARIVLFVSIAGFALFAGGGAGKFARLFGPALLLALVWVWIRARDQIPTWLFCEASTHETS